jgi:hypothetical protein
LISVAEISCFATRQTKYDGFNAMTNALVLSASDAPATTALLLDTSLRSVFTTISSDIAFRALT